MSSIRRLAVAAALSVAMILGLGGTAHAETPAPPLDGIGDVLCPPVCGIPVWKDGPNEDHHWG